MKKYKKIIKINSQTRKQVWASIEKMYINHKKIQKLLIYERH
jgi:hypothetical protein